MYALKILLISATNRNVIKLALTTPLLIILPDCVLSHTYAQIQHTETQLHKDVCQSALSITMLMYGMILYCASKFALKVGMQMIILNIVLLFAQAPIRLMGLILQINVLKFVPCINMPKIIQECACLIVLMDLLLTIMFESASLNVLLPQISMVRQSIILVLSNVPLILTGMLITPQGCVYLTALLASQHSQTG